VGQESASPPPGFFIAVADASGKGLLNLGRFAWGKLNHDRWLSCTMTPRPKQAMVSVPRESEGGAPLRGRFLTSPLSCGLKPGFFWG